MIAKTPPIVAISFLIGLFHTVPAFSQELHLGADVDAGSPALNLAKTPIGVTLMRSAALTFRDNLLESKLNEEFKTLQDRVSNAITNEKLGFLLEVNLFVNEFGAPSIPGGQLLFPIGLGTEPVDAMAEYLRVPSIRAEGSTGGLKNVSYFYWITKNQGQLVAQAIRREFRGRLIELATGEARRRDLLGAWRHAFPGETFQSIARAEYWLEVERARAAQVKSETRRQEVARLTAEMSALQSEMNGLYQRYQEVERELARQNSYLSTLETISTITSLVENGMKVSKLFSSATSQPVAGADQKPEVSLPGSIEWTKREIQIQGDTMKATETRVRMRFDELKNLDFKLEELYRKENVPIPHRDWPVPLLP